MYKVFFCSIIAVLFLFSSCTKDVPKEMLNKKQQMPNDSVHSKLQKQNTDNTSSEELGDKKAEEMVKAADDADAKFTQTKSVADKKECITKQLAAANYLMFDANLSPKKKYRPALKRYKRVLELDPSNIIAQENKQQIEDIYKSMGMPIPE